MVQETIRQKLLAEFDRLPRQLRQAARYTLDHPRDVALLSMREQAREAGVPPATMTRLAQRIGFAGYDEVRSAHAATLRGATDHGFTAKAGMQVEHQRRLGDQGLAADMLKRLGSQVDNLGEQLDRLERAARILSEAHHIHCVGLRSSYAIAWHLHYMLSLISDRSTLLDGPGGTGPDAAMRLVPGDALVAISVAPYTKATVLIAHLAASNGATVVAITDSNVSPLARIAAESILVATGTAAFLHAMTPAFVVTEILGALVAGRLGESALAALERFDAQSEALGTHVQPPRRQKGGDL